MTKVLLILSWAMLGLEPATFALSRRIWAVNAGDAGPQEGMKLLQSSEFSCPVLATLTASLPA